MEEEENIGRSVELKVYKPAEEILQAAFPVGFSSDVNDRGRRILTGDTDDGYWFHAKEYIEVGVYFVMVGQKFVERGNVEMGTFYREYLKAEELATIPDIVSGNREKALNF
jgi:hypothetical protein